MLPTARASWPPICATATTTPPASRPVIAALFADEVARRRDSLRPHSKVFDLLLMHGTDHMEPPRDTSSAIRSAAGKLQGDRLIHSTLPAYFAAVSSAIRRRNLELPVVRGELRSPKRHHLLPGVLSTRMWIKQRNRECETLLERWAEPFSAWASIAVPPRLQTPLVRDPAGALRAAWRMLMQNHPHDSICGCSIDEVHEEMRPRFAQAAQIGEEIARASLDALAAAVDTSAGEKSIVVFNPAPGPTSGPVEADLHPPADWDAFEIIDPSGTVIPHQAAAESAVELINVVLGPGRPGRDHRQPPRRAGGKSLRPRYPLPPRGRDAAGGCRDGGKFLAGSRRVETRDDRLPGVPRGSGNHEVPYPRAQRRRNPRFVRRSRASGIRMEDFFHPEEIASAPGAGGAARHPARRSCRWDCGFHKPRPENG